MLSKEEYLSIVEKNTGIIKDKTVRNQIWEGYRAAQIKKDINRNYKMLKPVVDTTPDIKHSGSKTTTHTPQKSNPNIHNDIKKLAQNNPANTAFQSDNKKVDSSYGYSLPYMQPQPVVKPSPIVPKVSVPPIKHNYMSEQLYKNMRFGSGMKVGHADYLNYVKQYNLNNPPDTLNKEINNHTTAHGLSTLSKGKTIEEHSQESGNRFKEYRGKDLTITTDQTKEINIKPDNTLIQQPDSDLDNLFSGSGMSIVS